MMKRNYQNVELEIVFFSAEDVIRTSLTDNTGEMPDFPEDFTP